MKLFYTMHYFCGLFIKIRLSQTEVIKKWVLLSSENKHLMDKKLYLIKILRTEMKSDQSN